MKYARVNSEGTVLEVVEVPEGQTIADCLHPDIAVLFAQAPDNAKAHDTYIDGVWTSVELPPEPGPDNIPDVPERTEVQPIPTTEV